MPKVPNIGLVLDSNPFTIKRLVFLEDESVLVTPKFFIFPRMLQSMPQWIKALNRKFAKDLPIDGFQAAAPLFDVTHRKVWSDFIDTNEGQARRASAVMAHYRMEPISKVTQDGILVHGEVKFPEKLNLTEPEMEDLYREHVKFTYGKSIRLNKVVSFAPETNVQDENRSYFIVQADIGVTADDEQELKAALLTIGVEIG